MACRRSIQMQRRLAKCMSRSFSWQSQQSLLVPELTPSPVVSQEESIATKLSSKCDYVKALYGFGETKISLETTVSVHRSKQAAMLALQNYLHYRKGVPLDDAVFISSNAPCYIDNLIMRFNEAGKRDPANQEQLRVSIELMMQREGIDEMEPFLESIGILTSMYGEILPNLQRDLLGDQGLLMSAKALDFRGIPKPTYWKLITQNKQLLNYSTREFLYIVDTLQAFGVKDYDLAKAVESCPSCFTKDLEQIMKPIVQQLEMFGIEKDAIGRIIVEAPSKYEALMEIDLNGLCSVFSEMGMPQEEIVKLMRENPVILVGSSAKKVTQLFKFLKDLLMEDDQIIGLVVQYPKVLVLNLEKSVIAKVDYLMNLGMKRAFIKAALMKTPQVLSYSLEENLKPKMEFLESIGIAKMNQGSLLSNTPSTLFDIVSNDLRKKANFLLTYGVRRQDLGDIIFAYPEVAGLSLEKQVKPTLDYLKKMGIDLKGIRMVIFRCPAVLGYDVELCIKPVIDFLESIGFPQDLIFEMIFLKPSILGASVKDRLELKYRYFEKLGFDKGSREMGFALARGHSCSLRFMDKRLRELKKIGLSEKEIVQLLKESCRLLFTTDEEVFQKINYLVNTMKLKVDYLLKFPKFLTYDLKTRLRARHRLIEWLKWKRVVRKDYPVSYMHLPDHRFDETFGNCCPGASEIFHGKKWEIPVPTSLPVTPTTTNSF